MASAQTSGGFPLAITQSGSYVLTSNLGTGVGIHSTSTAERVTVKNGVVRGMGATGIELLGSQSRVQGVHANQNGGYGIKTLLGIVADNTAMRNSDRGIWAVGVGVVRGNITFENGGVGIRAESSGSLVEGNTATSNVGNGIEVPFASLAKGNVAIQNGGVGLELGPSTGYTQNVVGDNVGGTVTGGVQIGQNVCNGNTTCP